MVSLLCRQCGQDTSAQGIRKGLCRACYQYQFRTGRARPDYLCFTSVQDCPGCDRPLVGRRRGVCQVCYARTWQRTQRMKAWLAKIHIKSIITNGKVLTSSLPGVRIMAGLRQPGVSQRVVITLGRFNANYVYHA
jgi:hypothetical protein